MAARDNQEYFIRQSWKLWVTMRDGGPDPDGGPDWPGFWRMPSGKPIQPGDVVPKEAYRGMVGAMRYLLCRSGVLWRSKPKREKSADAFRDAAARSKLGQSVGLRDSSEDDDEDEDEEAELRV